jgi:hypothetical protein
MLAFACTWRELNSFFFLRTWRELNLLLLVDRSGKFGNKGLAISKKEKGLPIAPWISCRVACRWPSPLLVSGADRCIQQNGADRCIQENLVLVGHGVIGSAMSNSNLFDTRAGHRRDRPCRRPGRFGREGSSEEEREEGKRRFLKENQKL